MNIKKILTISFILFFTRATANNILVQNVTTTGNNATNKTILVQFDLSWDNSWRDSINWDAAWIFIKFKDAGGLWQHAKLNLSGFSSGTGTANTIKVTSDSVGAWTYRSSSGSGTFNSTAMRLQWNYGRNGLNDVTGLEVRVFATEMVYVPEGDFNVAKGFYIMTTSCCGSFNGTFNAPGSNFPVINQRLTPTLSYTQTIGSCSTTPTTNTNLRIKGDAGIDTNNDGVIDNTNYPLGYRAFYCFKYELSEQQYADFLNTLTLTQLNTVGVAGTGITLTNGQYFSSTPNKACGNSNAARLLSYSDWAGLRPISLLEFNKASYGPLQPVYSTYAVGGYPLNSYPAWGESGAPTTLPVIYNSSFCGGRVFPILSNVGYSANSASSRQNSGSSYYGIMDLTWNAYEPVVKMDSYSYSSSNGNGILLSDGNPDVNTWSGSMIIFIEQARLQGLPLNYGFRYVRSAE